MKYTLNWVSPEPFTFEFTADNGSQVKLDRYYIALDGEDDLCYWDRQHGAAAPKRGGSYDFVITGKTDKKNRRQVKLPSKDSLKSENEQLKQKLDEYEKKQDGGPVPAEEPKPPKEELDDIPF